MKYDPDNKTEESHQYVDDNDQSDIRDEAYQEDSLDGPYQGNISDGRVAMIVGKWAMPTTVILVLITCMSGLYLSESAFTPVVGMISPVVMTLIMVIKEASVGKEEDPAVQDREGERKERMDRYEHETEIKLAQMEHEERAKNQLMKEQARQFDMCQISTKEFVKLISEMNNKMTSEMAKPKSTELTIGDTKIKINDHVTSFNTADEVK